MLLPYGYRDRSSTIVSRNTVGYSSLFLQLQARYLLVGVGFLLSFASIPILFMTPPPTPSVLRIGLCSSGEVPQNGVFWCLREKAEERHLAPFICYIFVECNLHVKARSGHVLLFYGLPSPLPLVDKNNASSSGENAISSVPPSLYYIYSRRYTAKHLPSLIFTGRKKCQSFTNRPFQSAPARSS